MAFLEVATPMFALAMTTDDLCNVRQARESVSAWLLLHAAMPEERVADAVVVVSELCTNVLLHTPATTFAVRGWQRCGKTVRVEVRASESPRLPLPVTELPSTAPGHIDGLSENGRGLPLVSALITDLGGQWGFTPEDQTAWFEIPLGQGEDRGCAVVPASSPLTTERPFPASSAHIDC